MQNRWIPFTKGCITIRLKGDYVERFFNMCRAHEIMLWNIKREEQCFVCSMFPEDYRSCVSLMKKTGTRGKVLQKSGLPFYFPFMRKRVLFFMGVFLCLAMLYLVTDYVWAIEYVGNQQISEDELTDFLKKEQIHYGIRKNRIDCEEKEKQLRAAFPNVTWTSIYFEGTKLYVEVKENDKKEPQERIVKGTDLVAEEAGTVASIITRNGIPQVKVGDTVEEGQILVQGSVPIPDDGGNITGYQVYDADADILLQTAMTFTIFQKRDYPQILYSAEPKKRIFIQVLDFYLETPVLFWRDTSYETIRERKQVKLLDNLYLPLFYGTVISKEYQINYLSYTDEEIKQILSDKLSKNILCLQEKGVQIIEKNVKIVKNNKGMELQADLLVIKPTGSSVPIQQEEGQRE